jgi:hypothetical protein
MTATRLARIASTLATLVTIAARPAAAQWAPPIGIPAPSFGITNIAPATPNPWTVAKAGFYYVDATNILATDSSNPYGTPARPRQTIPIALPAGAVVELHGTYDTAQTSPNTLVANGTAAAPVYIRGVSSTAKPIVRRSWELQGSYLILENVEFGPQPDLSDTGSVVVLLPSSHVVLRHNDIHGILSGGGLGIVNWQVPYGVPYTGTGVIDNVVVWDNYIHDNGDVNASYDQDVHGIGVSDHVQYLWIVDNEIARNSGDGMQINAGLEVQGSSTHHIYAGRNNSHDNKQTGMWVKFATDVIFSQNDFHSHRPSNSSNGSCTGGQYGPDYVWFIYNHVHDCEYGITQMSDNGEQSHWFLIGNVIENIHASQASDPRNSWSPSAIMMAGGWERHIINNTIYNVDSGVNLSSPDGTVEIADNIITNITQPLASHVIMGFASIAANALFRNNLLYPNARMDWGQGYQIFPTAAQLAQASSLSVDPQFVNVTTPDLHILISSPARNAAEMNASYGVFLGRYGVGIGTDFDGKARSGSVTDMGAYLASGQPGAAPVVTTNPSNVRVRSGMMATFSAAATGNPTPMVQWQVSTNGGSTFTNIAAANGTTYSFIVTPQDDGKQFRGVFANSFGVVVTASASLAVARSIVSDDFDGDGLADITVFRPSNGTWFTLKSGTNFTTGSSTQWGNSADIPVPGDYDGDGKTDVAVFRPSNGTWYIVQSSTGTAIGVQWGNSADIPVPGDYDGDGKTDIAIFRPSTGTWFIIRSSTGTAVSVAWGNASDIPVAADYDGDGKTDIAIFRPSNGTWYIIASTTGAPYGVQWGNGSDLPVVGDYDGDGKADIAVFRPSNGTWYVIRSSTGVAYGVQWGNGSDVPVPADYDGDGRTDIAVFRPSTGTWFVMRSRTGTGFSIQWGNGNDLPILKRP